MKKRKNIAATKRQNKKSDDRRKHWPEIAVWDFTSIDADSSGAIPIKFDEFSIPQRTVFTIVPGPHITPADGLAIARFISNTPELWKTLRKMVAIIQAFVILDAQGKIEIEKAIDLLESSADRPFNGGQIEHEKEEMLRRWMEMRDDPHVDIVAT